MCIRDRVSIGDPTSMGDGTANNDSVLTARISGVTSFINGFNAFTGETGAGKSIIIEGLKLALGGKNQTNLNLKENEISSIKAVFEINNLIKKNLDELNLIIEDDYLIVERQINSNQKSKLLVNGEIKPLSNIKGILKNVIEFQENFEQQELFDNKYISHTESKKVSFVSYRNSISYQRDVDKMSKFYLKIKKTV